MVRAGPEAHDRRHGTHVARTTHDRLDGPRVRSADRAARPGHRPHSPVGQGDDRSARRRPRRPHEIGSGEFVAIVGPSGSGKSTLGALLAGIDRPTSGSLVVDGVRIDQLSNDRLARWRGGNVGIVFQNFHLLPTLDARTWSWR